jgi:phytoene dehydrogenase-like protein
MAKNRPNRPGDDAPAPVAAPAPVHRNNRPNDHQARSPQDRRDIRQDRRETRRDDAAAAADAAAGAAKKNASFTNDMFDDNPLEGWGNHWAQFGFGGNADPTFGESAMGNWFNNDYYNTMRSRWVGDTANAGPGATGMHWNDWLTRNGNMGGMQSAWAQQSALTRGLPGRVQSRWMAV